MGRCSGMSPSGVVCGNPRHRVGWDSTGGRRVCARCHPPADPGLVAGVVIVIDAAEIRLPPADVAAYRAGRNGNAAE